MNRLSLENKDKLEFADYLEFINTIEGQALESYNDVDVIEFDRWLAKQMRKTVMNKLSKWEKLYRWLKN